MPVLRILFQEDRAGMRLSSLGNLEAGADATVFKACSGADGGSMFGLARRNPAPLYGVHLGVTSPLFRCPCCGYRTLKAPEAMELCPVCWWEDDGQEDADASEVRLTVNGVLSLAEARRHFLQCGAAHPRFLRYVRRPQASEQ